MRRNMAFAAPQAAMSAGPLGMAGDDAKVAPENWGPSRAGALRGGSLRQMGGVGMLQRHADYFELTDDQLDKLEEMRFDFELEKVDKRAAMRKAKICLRRAIRQEAPVECDVMAAVDAVAQCESELRKMGFFHMQKARAVLEPAQRDKVKTLRRSRELEKAKKWRQQRQPV